MAEYIYKLTNRSDFEKDYGPKNQIRRAVVSISSNLAEGDERQSNKEAVYFFNVAKGSTAEVITQLHIAHRIGYIDKKALDYLEDKAEKIRASTKNLIKKRGGSSPVNLTIWFILGLFGL